MATSTHEREVVLDESTLFDDQAEAVRKATERAERAEAELAKLKNASAHKAAGNEPVDRAAHQLPAHQTVTNRPAGAAQTASDSNLKTPPSPSSRAAVGSDPEGEINLAPDAELHTEPAIGGGEQELRKDSMMAHLLDSLDAGEDIGHYGRLVFAMVARHFLSHEEVLAYMMKSPDVDEEKATLMLRQVEGKDYNPPRRDKILQYQAQQEFPILPNPEDPDCGNLYRNLKFPNEIYDHISHYQEAKLDSDN